MSSHLTTTKHLQTTNTHTRNTHLKLAFNKQTQKLHVIFKVNEKSQTSVEMKTLNLIDKYKCKKIFFQQ